VTLQDSSAGEAAGLSSKEAAEVLRYWQALLRYEEALSSRPRARRPATGAPAPTDLAAPVPGQDYMKLPFGGAERFLVEQHGPLRLPLDAERMAFFEHWLAAKYRQTEDESRTTHLALFPILHSPREELLGLLRFPVELRWWSAEQRFEVPEPDKRRGPSMPALPTEIEIREPGQRADGSPPFFVDLKLLRETLRVGGDELDTFCALLQRQPALTGPEQVSALCKLLEAGRSRGGRRATGRCRSLARAPAASARAAAAPDRLGASRLSGGADRGQRA
jgi:hypothetical protein